MAASQLPAYKRVLLKLSGEALMGEQKFGVEYSAAAQIAQSIQEVYSLGVQIGIVVGGGNIFRGAQAQSFGFARTPADHVGMLATAINGLVLQQALSRFGIRSRVMSAFPISSVIEVYNWGNALHALEQGTVVIFVGGTGNPYFTTDSAAALRASEMQAEVLFKATKVDGIFSADPLKHPDAEKYDTLGYTEVLARGLQVMDATAVALCQENRIPICVFNLFERGSLLKAVCGQPIGTLVNGG